MSPLHLKSVDGVEFVDKGDTATELKFYGKGTRTTKTSNRYVMSDETLREFGLKKEEVPSQMRKIRPDHDYIF